MKTLLNFILTLLACSHLQGNVINWSSPSETISGVIADVDNPLLAMDADGNSVAAWIDNNFVKASTHAPNGDWTPEAIVSGSNASSPSLVSDRNGNATLAWVGNGIIYASSKALNGTWSSPKALSSSGAASPSLGVDDAGDVIAAWVRGGNIEVTTKRFGKEWQRRVIINSTSAGTPRVAIGGTGNKTRGIIAWEGISNGTKVIFTSTKLIPGNWTPQTLISDTMHSAVNPQVAVDPNGNVLAIWYEYDVTGTNYTNVTLKSSKRLYPREIWTNSVALSQPGICNPSSLISSIGIDGSGNAIAVWNISFDDETFNIQTATRPVNGQWSTAQDIISSNRFAYDHSISVTNFGDTLGLYMSYNGSNLLIQPIESNINGYMNQTWSVPVILSAGPNNATPRIAATVKDNKIYAMAIWINFDGIHSSISAMGGEKTLVLPPSNLNVTQSFNNFGVFGEYSNTLSWSASSDPNAAGYLIFRNGLFVEQVGSDVFSYIDDNRVRNGPVKYSVTAIDAEQTQSSAVSISFP